MYFLKDILACKKAYVPNDKVQTLYVPQYKNLSIERILEFVSEKPNISNFLPDDIDLEKVPKQRSSMSAQSSSVASSRPGSLTRSRSETPSCALRRRC